MEIEVRVGEQIDERWSDWLDGLAIAHTGGDPDRGGPTGAGGETVLTGPIADQAALYGLIAKLRDLGLSLLLVRCVDAK